MGGASSGLEGRGTTRRAASWRGQQRGRKGPGRGTGTGTWTGGREGQQLGDCNGQATVGQLGLPEGRKKTEEGDLGELKEEEREYNGEENAVWGKSPGRAGETKKYRWEGLFRLPGTS